MLSVQNCSISDASRSLIQNMSFTVSSGEVLTLMGPSGAGNQHF